MKKALIFTYIAAVLSISFMARANAAQSEVELLGSTMTYSEETQTITITGRYPNVCTSGAQFEVSQVDEQTIALHVLANRPSLACAAVLGAPYEIVIPAGVLKSKLPESLVEQNVYAVVTSENELVAEIDFTDVQEKAEQFLNVKSLIQFGSGNTTSQLTF